MLCAAGRTTLPTRGAKTITWLARGLCFRAADRPVHWNISVKSHKKANSVATHNFCWARGPFRSQQLCWDVPAWSGLVQTYANHYSQFSSLDPNSSNSPTFCSDDHACPLTRALRTGKRLCWRIKSKAPMGAIEDQIIHMGENLWNCCNKSQVKKQENKQLKRTHFV